MSYAIYIGRDAGADGHGYLAGYGDEPSSHWLEVVPRRTHPPGARIEVGVTPEALMPGIRSTIPQVSETARHLRVSYTAYRGIPAPLTNGGLNEHGVAVRDVWSPSSERLRELTPRDQRGPTYSDLARIALERARTARDAVILLGDLIAEFGESTYGGNSHLIADLDEAWVVIQFAGGQGLWVAERLGPGSIRVLRPGYILEVPADFVDHPDFMGSPHLIDFAVDHGWYDAASGPFNANAVYGDAKGRWPGVAWMETQLAERASRPEGIGLPDLFSALRSERLTGDSAGYGQVVPLAPVSDAALRTLWHAPIGAIAAPFTPFVLGIRSIAPEFQQHRYLSEGEAAAFVDDSDPDDPHSAVSQGIEATRSAVFTFKRLLYLLAEHHETFLGEVTPVWQALEQEMADSLAAVIAQAEILIHAGHRGHAEDLLTRHCNGEAIRSLDLGEKVLASIEARSRILFGIRPDRTWRGPERLW